MTMRTLSAVGLLAGTLVLGCRRTGGFSMPAVRSRLASHGAWGAAGTHLVAEVSTGRVADAGRRLRQPALQHARHDQDDATSMNLHVVTTFSTGIPHGHEGQPLVFGNTMYVVTPFPNNLIAVDLTKPGGAVKWIYEPHPDPRAVGIACCDVVNRGASFARRQDHLQPARRAPSSRSMPTTGKEAWRTKRRRHQHRRDVHRRADRRQEQGHRRQLGRRARRARLRGVRSIVHTGKELWRAYNTGPDNDVKIGPDFHAVLREGPGQGPRRRRPGRPSSGSWAASTVWGWISYDPETNLFFYGTGNPGVWNRRPAARRQQVVVHDLRARRRHRRGELGVPGRPPHDSWDYDEIMENVLVDMDYGGRAAQAADPSRAAPGSSTCSIARPASCSRPRSSSRRTGPAATT